jgi:hypothetical protein
VAERGDQAKECIQKLLGVNQLEVKEQEIKINGVKD